MYCTFDDLYPPEANTRTILKQEIQKYDLDDFLQTASKLNYFLFGKFGLDNNDDLLLLQSMGDDEIYKLAKYYRRVGYRQKTFIHHQIVALIMENLLIDENVSDEHIFNNIKDLRKCAIRTSDFLENDLPNIGSDFDKSLGALFRNHYFNSTTPYELLLGRYYGIFFKYLPLAIRRMPAKTLDYVKEFELLTSVELKLYMVLVFQVWAHYGRNVSLKSKQEFLSDPGHYIINNDLEVYKHRQREKAQRAFRIFSNDREGFFNKIQEALLNGGKSINYYNFSALWKTPIYRLPNGNYFLLDLEFLQQKATIGVKWELLDLVSSQINVEVDPAKKIALKKKRDKINTTYGESVHLYVNALLNRITRHQGHTKLIQNEGKGADFIIYDDRYPDSIIFIEFTTSWIRQIVAMSGDLTLILDEFENRFVKEKISQLDKTVIDFENGKLPHLNQYKDKATNIYTVLVTETGFPLFPEMTDKYYNLIRKHNLLTNHIGRFQFLDLEELELIEPLIKSKESEHRLLTLLDSKLKSEWSKYAFKNFLSDRNIMKRNMDMFREYTRQLVWDSYKYLDVSLEQIVADLWKSRIVEPIREFWSERLKIQQLRRRNF